MYDDCSSSFGGGNGWIGFFGMNTGNGPRKCYDTNGSSNYYNFNQGAGDNFGIENSPNFKDLYYDYPAEIIQYW